MRNVLEKIKDHFKKLGDHSLNASDVLSIIENIEVKYTVPDYIKKLEDYVKSCDRDMGFMGSPTYYDYKKQIEAYYRPFIDEEKQEKEIQELEELKIRISELESKHLTIKNKHK